MRELLKDFLEYLRYNRNASAHTIRAYESDITRHLGWLAQQRERRIDECRGPAVEVGQSPRDAECQLINRGRPIPPPFFPRRGI